MTPDLLEPIPASRLRRDLGKVLRRLDRGEGPFRITQRTGPDLVLLALLDFERPFGAGETRPEVPDASTA